MFFGQLQCDMWIMLQIFQCVKKLYQDEGGVLFELILNLVWDYVNFVDFMVEELVKEMNGCVLVDVYDLIDKIKLVVKVGMQFVNFGQFCDDGMIMGGCWIFFGCWIEEGNIMVCCDNIDLDEIGVYLGWFFVWLMNWWILYNCVLVDLQGRLWDVSCKLIEWNGEKWVGYDIFDILFMVKFGDVGLFIMNLEGILWLFMWGMMCDGFFLMYMEFFELFIVNLFNDKMVGNLVVCVFVSDVKIFGMFEEFFFVVILYCLIEYFYYWIKYNCINVVLQFEFFVEISFELVEEKGIIKGGMVWVWFKWGQVMVKVLISCRLWLL